MIAIMIMLFSLPANVQGKVGYAQYDVDSKTLTFYGGESVPSGAFALKTGSNQPDWYGNTNCTTVVFHESFKDVRPTSCYKWFCVFSQLTTIEGIENLNTEKVTDMRYMFSNCRELTSLDLSSFNTANVMYMSYMFNNCQKLTSLDLSSFNTANVTYMSYMFSGCSGLSSLDLSSFKTANVTNMNCMFNDCSGLTSLDLSSFNTAKVTNMEGMFGGCSGLTSLDVSSFNTANVEYMDEMFNNCQDLTTICVSDNFSIGNVTYDLNMFSGCSKLVGATSYSNSGITDKSMANYKPGYFTKSNLTPYVKWDANTKVLTFKVAHYIEGTEGEWKFNEGAKDPGWSIDEVKNYCTKVVFTPSFKQARPTSCCSWFWGFLQLTTIEGIENLNTEDVTNMSEMFNGCSGLTSLDLSSFNTAEVTYMGYMFYNCKGLKSLDLSSFNTAKVESMSYMFRGCSGLTSLDLSNFNTANVTTMAWMFSSCSSLPSLKLSSFNTANVTNMSAMFDNCSNLTSLDLSSFNTAKVTTMGSMFNGCSGLTSLNLSSFNTANVTDMNDMFNGCSGLRSLTLSSFNTDNVTDMRYMFSDCSGLTSLTLSSFNTDKVKNMKFMFKGCKGLTSLDLSSFNTANVEDMGCMFSGCKGLTSLDVSSFNTAKVTNMYGMFSGCSSLTTIFVSDDFKIGNGTDGHEMFSDCTSLEGAAPYDSDKRDKSMANYRSGYFKTYFTLGENKVELCGNPLTTNSLNLTGDYDFTPKYEFKANEATYSRDLSSSGSTWFSLCLPFAYTPNNFNFTAYKLNGATANAVEIEEITGEIVAGTPVLFKFKDGVVDKTINLSATDAQIVKAPVEGAKVTGPDGSSLQLCGTYQTKTFSKDADGNAFILLKDKLMNPAKMMLENQNVTTVGVKPFRAYMTLTASAQTSSARAFSIGRGDEGNEGTTAIDLLNSVATDDAEYYDINGRRIDAPAKGVNIVRRGNKTIKLIIK